MIKKIKSLFEGLYIQIVKLDDSPHSIAMGFGVGVCLGILPFTGVLAAVFLAMVFRFNKASALIGSLVTNTWLSVVTFVFAIQIGSAVLGIDWQNIITAAREMMMNFTWKVFFDTGLLKILWPLTIGYLTIGFVCGVVSYVVIFLLLLKFRRR